MINVLTNIYFKCNENCSSWIFEHWYNWYNAINTIGLLWEIHVEMKYATCKWVSI